MAANERVCAPQNGAQLLAQLLSPLRRGAEDGGPRRSHQVDPPGEIAGSGNPNPRIRVSSASPDVAPGRACSGDGVAGAVGKLLAPLGALAGHARRTCESVGTQLNNSMARRAESIAEPVMATASASPVASGRGDPPDNLWDLISGGRGARQGAAGSGRPSGEPGGREDGTAADVSREELGRATWTLLHTLAAQFPEAPTKRQQKDVKLLMHSLSRVYPCGVCAQHFQEILRNDPPVVSSGPELQQWMCRLHNTVNRSLGKPTFNCRLVQSRWSPLECDDDSSCDMTVGRKSSDRTTVAHAETRPRRW
eukprot:evm.model.scf_819.6 EVM.evm.TU.scf_819.6   scf_819:44702-47287(+)